MPNQLQYAGSQGGVPAPLFTDRFFLGLVTNRNRLRSPLGAYYSKFLSSNDALIDGTNVEVSNRLTLIRRPGNTAGLSSFITSANVPDIIDSFYSFHELNGQVRVFADTPSAPYLLTSTAVVQITSKLSSTQAFYQGIGQTLYISDAIDSLKWNDLGYASATATITAVQGVVFPPAFGGGSSVFATIYANNTYNTGQTVTISGLTNTQFNGTWVIDTTTPTQFTFIIFNSSVNTTKTSDSGTATVTLSVAGNSIATITNTQSSSSFGGLSTITALNSFYPGQTVTISGTTNGSGAFNGTFTVINANPASFQFKSLGNITSAADTGFASGPWNFGIAAPTQAPTIQVIQSASAATSWQASTWFSTMGVLIDSNGNAQQLTSVNATGTNPNTQFGTSSNGQPSWNQTPGGTTVDNTITWQNKGPVGFWSPNTTYNGINATGTNTPASIYDPITGLYFWNSLNTTATSGSIRPTFHATPGGVNIPDGGCRWVQILPTTWHPSTAYTIDSTIIEPITPPNGTQTTFLQVPNANGTSAANYTTPNWQTGTGQVTVESNGILSWINLGSATWAATTQYVAWSSPNNHVFSCVQFNIPKHAGGNVQGLQVCTKSGQSGASAPWIVWQANHTYAAGNLIIDENSNIQLVTVGGTSGAGPNPPAFNTSFNGTTTDNTVTWINQGAAYGHVTQDGSNVQWTYVGLATGAVWTASQQYYLPNSGFFAPNPFDPFGGAEIIDSNNNVQFVVDTGTSKTAPHPVWNTNVPSAGVNGGYTSDNNIRWYNDGVAITNGRSWSFGFGYVYSFKARSTSDLYLSSTTVPLGQSVLPAPTGSADGSVSTASPAVSFSSSNAGAVINITGWGPGIIPPGFTGAGTGVNDPQVDTISIFRTADGGSTFFKLVDIPAPPAINGFAQQWIYQDFIPDNATSTSSGLQTLIIAPISHFNDPPPQGLVNIVLHLGRIFGSVGSTVFCSEGPLVGGSNQPPGNGFTAFNPGQNWQFPSTVTRLVPTSLGLFVFTTSDLHLISGGPAITNVFQSILIPGLGLSSYNALSTTGNLIMFVTADNQFVTLDPSMGVSEVGVNIGDQINTISPTKAYVAHLIQGSNDKAAYVADGSTGWFRCNLTPSPDSPITGPVWSPFAKIAGGGGCGAIAALEYATGKHALFIGSTAVNKPVLVRDSTFATFTDNGTAYASNATIGSIVLANPGQLAELSFITCEFQKTGASPRILILLDEIYDSFLNITAASFSAGNTTYTYTLSSGIDVQVGMTITIAGFVHSGNNGTFVVTGKGAGTFTVVNANGFTESGQTATGTEFEDISGYISSSTSIPPQEHPLKYGLTTTPFSIYANRYFLLQQINATNPQPSSCRHLQIKIDFGSTDTVQNEILSMTIFGSHWQEMEE